MNWDRKAVERDAVEMVKEKEDVGIDAAFKGRGSRNISCTRQIRRRKGAFNEKVKNMKEDERKENEEQEEESMEEEHEREKKAGRP